MTSQTHDRIRRLYGMDKRATNFGAMLPMVGNALNTLGELVAMAPAYVIAAAALAGSGAGWITAKSTAKGEQDYDTAKKSYENEALAADIGYLGSRIRQEREALKDSKQAKPMRVFS